MMQTKSGWGHQDLVKLYQGFGFSIRHGSSHDIVQHPDHGDLVDTIPRHNKLAPSYAATAVKIITELKRRVGVENEQDSD